MSSSSGDLSYTPLEEDISYKNYIATVYAPLQDTIPDAVNLSLTLLKMGKKLPETCSVDLGDP